MLLTKMLKFTLGIRWQHIAVFEKDLAVSSLDLADMQMTKVDF